MEVVVDIVGSLFYEVATTSLRVRVSESFQFTYDNEEVACPHKE